MSRIIYNNKSGCYTLCKKNLGNSEKWYQYIIIVNIDDLKTKDISRVNSISTNMEDTTGNALFCFTRPFKLGDNTPLYASSNNNTYCSIGSIRYKTNILKFNIIENDSISFVNWFPEELYPINMLGDQDCNDCASNCNPNSKTICSLGGQIIQVKNKDDDQIIKKYGIVPMIRDCSDTVSLFKNSFKSKLTKNF